jgi:hypothetical protein
MIRLERASLLLAVVAGALGLATSAGCPPVRLGDPAWAWALHPLLLAAGAAAGMATLLRGRDIDRRRWEIVEEPRLTKGEREYAHKEAERQRRHSATIFLLGPVLLGYWLAFQFRGQREHFLSDLLILSPLVGYLAGLLGGRRFKG